MQPFVALGSRDDSSVHTCWLPHMGELVEFPVPDFWGGELAEGRPVFLFQII